MTQLMPRTRRSSASLAGSFMGSRPDQRMFQYSLIRDVVRDGKRRKVVPANLNGAILYGAEFLGSNFEKAQMERAYLFMSSFRKTKMRQAVMAGADLTRADFRGANLNYADMSGARAVEANFSSTKRTPTHLYIADLTGADIAHANFSRTDLTSVIGLETAQNLDLANFTGARLTEEQELAIDDAAKYRLMSDLLR